MATTPRLEAVLQLLDNTTTAEALAARHGVTVAEVEGWRSLYVAGLRQASSGQAPLQRRARTGLKVGLLAAGVGLLVGGAAWAQLVPFTADTPARATQVNANFTFLKDWIERKVGPLYATGTGADQVRIGATQDVGTSGTQGSLVVGATGGTNLGVDGDEIQARSGNGVNTLTLNRRGGNVALGAGSSTVTVPGNLNVTGALGRTNAIHVISRAGPLPVTSGAFTVKGGKVVMFIAGSGFNSSAGGVGMTVAVDGTSVATIGSYSNEVGSHKAFVPKFVPLTLSAGSHTVTLTANSGTATDANDLFEVSFIELPF